MLGSAADASVLRAPERGSMWPSCLPAQIRSGYRVLITPHWEEGCGFAFEVAPGDRVGLCRQVLPQKSPQGNVRMPEVASTLVLLSLQTALCSSVFQPTPFAVSVLCSVISPSMGLKLFFGSWPYLLKCTELWRLCSLPQLACSFLNS